MSDTPSLEERVARYRERNPDAELPEIAGSLQADPEAVREVLGEESTDSDEQITTRTGDCVQESPSWSQSDPNRKLPTLSTESGVFAEDITGRECWLPWRYLEERKQPHAIYADVDDDMSWSDPALWRDCATCRIACEDPRLEGPGIVLQHADDPYADAGDPYYVVDYDDVRDPETGAVHPVVADHVEQADTYADVSTSGTGVHIIGRGELPGDVKTIQGAFPDHHAYPDAEIEVYDGKRYVAMTGDHVVGTPTETTEAQTFLDGLVTAFVDEDQRRPADTPEPDAEAWEPEYDAGDLEDLDETTDIQAVFDACRQVGPGDIRLRSSETEERADGTKSFDPSWEQSRSGTRLGWDPDIGWIYRKGAVGLDAIQVVALEEGLIASPHEYPEGEDWWAAVDALRERGARIPEYRPSRDGGDGASEGRPPLLDAALEGDDAEAEADVDASVESLLPLAQLDALGPGERRRAARTRGLNWPTTDQARERLQETIQELIQHEDDRVVDAPTALGKTHTVAATRWGARGDVTGERPVVHLLETRAARDEAIQVAEEHGGSYHVLLGRHEACPVAGGDHDPRQVQECDADRQEVTVGGDPASQVLDRLCEHKGLPFSVAHQYVAEHNDQGVALPCGGDQCHGITQWDTYREGPSDREYWPLVIATHNFAYAPGLRMGNTVVIDEQPDYTQALSTERVRTAIAAYLQEIDAPVTTWETFVHLARYDSYGDDAAAEREALADALLNEPDREWYFEAPDAHVLAPALARAIFNAEDRGNGRRAGKTVYEPPRLEAGARDADEWNREWVSVVLDEANDVCQVRAVPDFNGARSLVGLDAHPAEPLWQVNTVPWITDRAILDREERRLWRRYERGLRVVQVGDATRPRSGPKAEEWFDDDRVRALCEHLREEYGAGFRTAVTTSQIEESLEAVMHEAGVASPELMHYGNEKSRNDFAGEPIGLVNGCMDPGDDYVLDLLAELDLDAAVETAVDGAGETYRAKGRGFEGSDAATAREILASVRENHIAQAAGRYARDADDSDAAATVFVRTDAAPDGFVDVQAPGVEWTFTDLQREMLDELRKRPGAATARELAAAVGCSKEYVRQTLGRLRGRDDRPDAVQVVDESGPDGATLYADRGVPTRGVVDLSESPTASYETTSRWVLAIRDPIGGEHADTAAERSAPGRSTWDWQSAGGGGPPN
ncbi:MAG: hypothetical protein ABEH56_02000 [Salinirussus sp.]